MTGWGKMNEDECRQEINELLKQDPVITRICRASVRSVRHEISFDEPLFAFAGIARECEVKGELRRCTVIITAYRNDIFAEVHNSKQRQAVVIRESDYDKWLGSRSKPEHLRGLLGPLPNDETHAKVAEPEASGTPTLFDF